LPPRLQSARYYEMGSPENVRRSAALPVPWLIQRFIDEDPEFLYVPADQVTTVAEKSGATPGVELKPLKESGLL
jgi:hypothetical protein